VLALAFLASLLCGALPAWRSSRANPAEVLKDEAACVSGSGHNRKILSGLVVTQIALSLALLVSSGLLLRTLRNMNSADPGFEQDHVLTATVGLGIAGYSSEEANAIQHKMLDRAAALPGVKNAALTDWLPLSFNGKTADVYPEGYLPQLHESHQVRRAEVTGGFFPAMGIPIVAGRDFTQDDNESAPRVVIVDETAARRYWPGANPIGRHLTIFGQPYTVVGVARNAKHQFINEQTEPMVFRNFFQGHDETTVMIQTDGEPSAMVPVLEDAIRQVNTQLPIFDVRSLRETAQVSSSFAVMESTFAAIFAIIALVLSATGIYGVISYRTQLRTHEIGIRMALGASRADVGRLVLLQGMWLTALGLALGLALSFGLTRFIAQLLYGVNENDPVTVAAVALLLAVMALVACWFPAHRAMRRDPVAAIREL
jgi:predicted permease